MYLYLRVDIGRGCNWLLQNGVEDGHQTVQRERFGSQELIVWLQQEAVSQQSVHTLCAMWLYVRAVYRRVLCTNLLFLSFL